MQNSNDQTKHNILLFIGVILTLLGVTGLVYSNYSQGVWRAANGVGGPGILLQVEVPKGLKMSETGIIRVNYEFAVPPDVDSTGQVTVPVVFETITMTLQTASFWTDPTPGQSIAKRVRNEVQYQWLWIISPQQVGQHHVALQFTGIPGPLLAEIASRLGVDQLSANSVIMNTQDWSSEEVLARLDDPNYSFDLVIPITVVDLFGLTALQAKIASGLLTFIGSGFTLAWLYEQWQKQRTERKSKRRSNKLRRRK